jgi:hypothetical protein
MDAGTIGAEAPELARCCPFHVQESIPSSPRFEVSTSLLYPWTKVITELPHLPSSPRQIYLCSFCPASRLILLLDTLIRTEITSAKDFKMWWGKGSDKPQPPKESPTEAKVVAKEVQDAAKEFDPKKLPDREELPRSLQKIVDKADREDNLYNELVEG